MMILIPMMLMIVILILLLGSMLVLLRVSHPDHPQYRCICRAVVENGGTVS